MFRSPILTIGRDYAVMGGRASSRLLVDSAGYADFAGAVSLADNGGFASVRSAPGDYAL